MNTGITKAFILRALKMRDGTPATEEMILIILASTFAGEFTRTEAKSLLVDMESEGLLAADTDPILKTRSYTLTQAGRLAATQLR